MLLIRSLMLLLPLSTLVLFYNVLKYTFEIIILKAKKSKYKDNVVYSKRKEIMKNLGIGIMGMGKVGNSVEQLLRRNGFKNIFEGDKRKNLDTIRRSNILFLTVRPQNLKHVLAQIDATCSNDKLIISLVTGASLENIETYLDDFPIIRGTLNIPISIGKGTIAYYPNRNVNEQQLRYFHDMLKGPQILRMKEESQIDTSTVLVGCGPAFISSIAQEYILFGVRNGLTVEESKQLYVSTLAGTVDMLQIYPSEDIISKVATPGGITEKGLAHLRSCNLSTMIQDSLNASYYSIPRFKD